MNEDKLIIFDPYGELEQLAKDIEKAEEEESKPEKDN